MCIVDSEFWFNFGASFHPDVCQLLTPGESRVTNAIFYSICYEYGVLDLPSKLKGVVHGRIGKRLLLDARVHVSVVSFEFVFFFCGVLTPFVFLFYVLLSLYVSLLL